ncbi:MAG: UbiX family flavin prenyltransferase [Helicobacteraceae bacterium]|jgi:4-hydroxy-3-polyprenylbenzoate decarboxylase|nr:UbiX family flavin prenyltransferase [Helicobacteraceae bacterium]
MKIIVAISGASAAGLGLRAYELIPDNHEKYLVVSNGAQIVLQSEGCYKNSDISAPIASGSFGADVMLIAPCSMNTLAKIACGIADNLITRSAAVMLKERRRLAIAPRELPFNAIALKNMLKLSKTGAIIAPPVLGYYADHKTIDDVERFIIGRWFDLLGIKNDLYKRWGDEARSDAK